MVYSMLSFHFNTALSHSPDHVQRKLRDALLEHLDYTKRILAKLSTCGNPYVVAEIYGTSRTLAGV